MKQQSPAAEALAEIASLLGQPFADALDRFVTCRVQEIEQADTPLQQAALHELQTLRRFGSRPEKYNRR